MRVLLLLAVVSFGSAARLTKDGGAGTQTILLIKGGVGVDVNLLSTSPAKVRHVKKDEHAKKDEQPHSAPDSEASELQAEQKIAEELTASLQNTADSSQKLAGYVKNLKARVVKAENLVKSKDQQLKQLKKKEAVAEKSLQVKSKMLLHERHENDLLKSKVKDLEKDIEVSNRAWKKAADHEKEVADHEKEELEAATESAKEEAAKNDRLSQEMDDEPQTKASAEVPKSIPSPRKFMKEKAKLVKKATTQVPVPPEPETADDDIATEEKEAAYATNEEEKEAADAINEEDVQAQQDISPEVASEDMKDMTQIPSEEEPMPSADDPLGPEAETVAEEQPLPMGHHSRYEQEEPVKMQPTKQEKKGKRAVVKPPVVQAIGSASRAHNDANTDSMENEDVSASSETEDSAPAEESAPSEESAPIEDPSSDADALKDQSEPDAQEDDSNWNLAYSPADRAAAVEDSVEGDTLEKETNAGEIQDAESDDVLSQPSDAPVGDAPMPSDEEPTSDKPFKPDIMGRV